MTVERAISYIDNFINDSVTEYKTDYLENAPDGTLIEDIPLHILESKDETDKLMALDYGIKLTALNTTPLSLLENIGSIATEYKKISTEEFIRLPTEPTIGGNLDIDESLSFAVIYKALSFLWSGYSTYGSDASSIYASHNDVSRDYLMSRASSTVEQKVVYFRYSSDGISYHDTYLEGDTFISFRQGDGVWSVAIKFVGSGGSSSGGVTTFKELTDTPNTLTNGKFLSSLDGNVIEVDAPTSGSTKIYDVTGASGIAGDIYIDWSENSLNNIYHYLDLANDINLYLSNTDGVLDIRTGETYTLEIFPNGFNCNIAFSARGNIVIEPTNYAHILQFIYDGLDIFVIQNVAYAN